MNEFTQAMLSQQSFCKEFFFDSQEPLLAAFRHIETYCFRHAPSAVERPAAPLLNSGTY